MLFLPDEIRQDGEESDDCENNPTGGIDEICRSDEQQRGRSHQSDDRETKHPERILEIGIALKTPAEPEIGPAYGEHDNQARQDNGGGGENTSPYRSGSRISDIGGAIDADGAGRDLTHGNDIDKLLLRHPSVPLHLHLNKRQNRQASSEAEETDFEE